MTTLNVQIAQYDRPTVHVQASNDQGCGDELDKTLFSKGALRDYGVAFNVSDADLWDELGERKATEKSMAGSSRRYVPATLERTDEGTLRFELEPRPMTYVFNVAHKAAKPKPVALPIA